ncbi:heme ABC exporter ATP-binding protein CcmA [Pelagibacterales bacterium]|jgi:heme exporter protein A|nr:heme ABC exporter ATP-binding protein CcmA [Pelagibacteraceae bacterium]MDA9980548.1 heme ABC exporter ATP-binding protein CcmA [Pelagibacterales bacterium]MDB4220225.1 heme ABC exporter ATP-binding protein CcmA [Pelagibacterales bacterium]MDB9818121.1 heme ABC exporter ATP-binding protein CcmA [Pelagibacterales bacterium]|tara:strand:- start:797 stop:1417 length:621 start_codon:yes stop_codon:yes gene_type:complete
MSNKLIIKNLECFREERTIFQRLSCEIESNQTMLVRGKNGSGKTSFLRLVAGYLKNYNGKVLFNDNDLQQNNEPLTDFRFIGQKNSLKDNLTVRKNIEMWQLIYHTKKDINKIVDLLDIRMLLNKDINTLSDGQKKRVSLSRLLISKAKVWLLDEPLVYLDLNKVKLLQDIILQHNDAGGITLYTSNTNIDLNYDHLINMDDYAIL